MVQQTQRDGTTWYVCEGCGMMFDLEADAKDHERSCDHEEPAYIQ